MSPLPSIPDETRLSETPTSPGGYNTASATNVVIPKPPRPVETILDPPQDSTPSSPPHLSSEVLAISSPPVSNSQSPSSPAATLQSQPEKQEQDRGTEKRPTIFARSLSGDSWLWELLGLLLGTGLVCAIVGILAKYDNNPQPQWKQGITITGLAAFLSTIAKSAILLAVTTAISQLKWVWYHHESTSRRLRDLELFDSASRGPWGAFLVVLRLRKFSIVFVGAIIVVTSLAFEFAVQQAIVLEARTSFVRTDAARVPRVTSYISYADDYSSDPRIADSDIFGQVTIRGIINSDGTPNLQPFCPAQSCKWPGFTSLAMCSRCADILQFARSRQNCSVVGGENNVTCSLDLERRFDFKLPFGSAATVFDYSGYLNEYDIYMSTGLAGTTNAEFEATYAGIQRPIFATRSFNWTLAPNNEGSPELKLNEAVECAVYACVKSYNVTVDNGTVIQDVISTWHNKTGTLVDPINEGGLTHDIYLYPPGTSPEEPFFLEGATWDEMQENLGVYFSGFYWSWEAGSYAYSGYSSQDFTWTFSNPSFSQVVKNVALALTDYIQTSSQSEPVFGQGSVTDTYVRIRWAWLVLPIILTALSLAFLLITIWTTHSTDTKLWKSSSLALLYHGLEPRPSKDVFPLDRLSQLTRQAEQGDFRLRNTDDDTGWGFLEVKRKRA